MTLDQISNIPLDERIDNGIRWLNENFPGWRNRIDINTLQLADPFRCICGQVFKDESESLSGYNYAYNHLFAQANSWLEDYVPMQTTSRASYVSILLGFECGNYENYLQLAEAWIAKLNSGE